ncbi:DUF4089 domain-containing protein [Rhodobium gokarnense]|uniref:Glucuronate isomerase n=1 Tax=Rhodobium gokarnense TaxID=364296 RepID=A0ABT3HBQ2_9HYPH|nr:DUF4089 domain-containing protein [Rhodobium gokarnense]MCW2307839.1 glucuronate isomerase [Rhodobium gokarnense]
MPNDKTARATMTEDREKWDAYMEAAMGLLGLEVRPEWREAVISHLIANAGAAGAVAAFKAPESCLPAPEFDPRSTSADNSPKS